MRTPAPIAVNCFNLFDERSKLNGIYPKAITEINITIENIKINI